MAHALLGTGRRCRRRRPWLATRSSAWAPGNPIELSLIWINPSALDEAIDLECISAAEADRRAAGGQLPIGLMVGDALFRRELTLASPAAWLRRTGRIVVCQSSRDAPLDVDQLGPVPVRLLMRPFGPGEFGVALAWLSGRPAREEVSPATG